ncbi:hypothetical protein I4F81_011415 [Pyropia yezoensis]|uniref:Uncharacterized protein n=1 Tax=Pyropia yezoensis TaxID=2788 RepID=A0ACC3CGE0_PYRYE|nr:hypothetical protein I4F81_011415 [Neopyropia yezoensis]
MAPGDGAAAAGVLLAAGALVRGAVAGVGPGVGGEGATRLVDDVRYVLVVARDGRAGGLNVLLDATAALLTGGCGGGGGGGGGRGAVADRRVPRAVPLAVRPAPAFVASFNATFGALAAAAVCRGGREVGYARIRAHPAWRVYLAHVAEAAHVTDWAAVGGPSRLAFLLNLYNGLVLHAKLVYGHPSTLAARGTFFHTAAYVLGGTRYSLVGVEHQLLRRKAPPAPTARGGGGGGGGGRGGRSSPSPSPSPALTPPSLPALAVGAMEPRMHFALNCGAHRLFRWFRRDFVGGGTDAALLGWLAARAGPAARRRLAAAGATPRVVYQKYNWQDNGDWKAPPDTRRMRLYDLSFRYST